MFCFIVVMESVNCVNSNMKNQPLNMGVIVPPDDHYRPILYSDVKATQEFCRLNQDIYQGVKRSKNIKEKKTPLSVKIIFGIIAAAASIPLIKKVFRR